MSSSPTLLRRRSGDISALDAVAFLEDDETVHLVDVRPNGGDRRAQHVPFDGDRAAFTDRLHAAIPNRDRLLLVIDQGGETSQAVADLAATAGYRRVLNVADGFAGLDASCDTLIPEAFQA